MGPQRTAGAVIGGLAAGVALSAVMLAGEKLTARPSELIELERDAANEIGARVPDDDAPASIGEQFVTHGGHLALSALAGLAYAAAVDEADDGVASGTAFGLAFFAATYGLTGPLLGVTPPPWREQPLRAIQHPVVHVLFGISSALFARAASRNDRRSDGPGPESGAGRRARALR